MGRERSVMRSLGELFSQEEGREEELRRRRTETKTNTRQQIHQGLWRGSAGPPEVQVWSW